MATTKKNEYEAVKVLVHNGEFIQAGETVELTELQSERLLEVEAVKPVKTPKPKAKEVEVVEVVEEVKEEPKKKKEKE